MRIINGKFTNLSPKLKSYYEYAILDTEKELATKYCELAKAYKLEGNLQRKLSLRVELNAIKALNPEFIKHVI